MKLANENVNFDTKQLLQIDRDSMIDPQYAETEPFPIDGGLRQITARDVSTVYKDIIALRLKHELIY